MSRFQGKGMAISGAAQGIGLGMAERFLGQTIVIDGGQTLGLPGDLGQAAAGFRHAIDNAEREVPALPEYARLREWARSIEAYEAGLEQYRQLVEAEMLRVTDKAERQAARRSGLQDNSVLLEPAKAHSAA